MSSESSTARPFRYTVALGVTALVAAVSIPLSLALGDPAPLTLFVVASIVSAWYGGLGPGLLATVLGGLAGDFLVLEPLRSLDIKYPVDWVRLAIFLLAGGVVSWLSEALHQARRRAADEARQTRDALAQLEAERAGLLMDRQEQEAFRRSQERLNVAQKAARIGHFEWNIQTNENIWSPEIEALYGLPPGTFGGTYESWREHVHPEDLPPAEEVMRRSLVDGEFASEWRAVWPDGTIHWLRARAQVFFDAAGQPLRMVGVNMDVTHLKQAEEALRTSELRLELAMAAARLGSWHLDLDTFTLTCSASCKVNFGRPPNQPFTYEDLLESIHPDDREGMQAQVRQAVEEGIEYQAEYRVLWPDGSLHWIAARGRTTWEDGRPVSMDGITLDFTERKSLEESLRRQTEALQEADRHKNEFLAMLAHELLNPLAPIRNALQILALRGGEPAVIAQTRELMERQVQQIVRLVDDLLEVSRISRGKVKLEKVPLDLAEVVATAVETSRPLIESRRHELTVATPERPLRVEADPARLAQVLANLLNNAAKYMEPGGRIHLTADREGGQAVLRVRDTGVGIASEMLPKVFDLFTQVDSTLDRSQGGLGIGLTLASRLVEMHEGTIEAHSEGIGRGSEFVVRLPTLAEEPEAAPERPQAAGESTGARRILVVDDNVDAAESLAMLLELSGHEVRLAHDGEAALEETRAFAPNVVLLDIGLPKLNGYQVAQRLREDKSLNGVTLIAMTGYGQEEDRRRTREAGFHLHLVKPVDLNALQGALAEPPGL